MNAFTKEIMNHLELPEDAKELFIKISDKLKDNEEYKSYKETYDASEDEPWVNMLKNIEVIAEKIGEHRFSVIFVFLLECCERLYKDYKKNNIDLKIFYDSVMDLKYKFNECVDTFETYGTSVGEWFNRLFGLRNFQLGRFQFEPIEFKHDHYEKDGVVINKGDMVLNVHIPSGGGMTKEKREDSYKRAVEFFKNQYNQEYKAFVCQSWMLYKNLYDFLDDSSNVKAFMDEYDIITNDVYEGFPTGWRIFGKYYTLPYDELPENTKLQRSFKRMLTSGLPSGYGFGVKIIK